MVVVVVVAAVAVLAQPDHRDQEAAQVQPGHRGQEDSRGQPGLLDHKGFQVLMDHRVL